VSFVVSNYNGWRLGLIKDCLLSLTQLDYPNFEVLVVDNASKDQSARKIKDEFGWFKRLRIIQNTRNLYSLGLNIGLKESRGEYVVFLNNDLTLNPDYARRMVDFFEANSQLAIAMGKIMRADDRRIIDRIGDSMDLSGNPWLIGSQQVDVGQFDTPIEILSAGTTAAFTRKKMIIQIGMFDESYHIGYEDMDISIRAHLHGEKVAFNPNAVVYHLGAATDSRRELAPMITFHFDKNRLATIIKNFELRNLIKAIALASFFYAAAFIGELFLKRKIEIAISRVRALMWVVKNLPHLIYKRRQVQRFVRRTSDASFLRYMRHDYSLIRLLHDFRK